MEETLKKEETKTSPIKKVLSIVFNSIFYLAILLLLVFSISNLIGKDKNAPSVFGYYFMNVNSNSMEGNNKDSFTTKDIIITKKATAKSVSNLKVGDIVTYEGYVNGQKAFISHRIVDVAKRDTRTVYILQGDYLQGKPDQYNAETYASNREDYIFRNVVQEIGDAEVVAIYQTKWKNAGAAMTFLRSQTGFALCIILPTGVLLTVEIIFLIRNLSSLNKEKMKKQLADKDEEQKKQLEEERERMRQELLAEMAAKQNAEASESKEEDPEVAE